MKRTVILAIVIFVASCASCASVPVSSSEGGFKPPSLEGYWGIENIYISMQDEIPQWAKDMYKTPKIGGYCPAQFLEDEKYNLAFKVVFKNERKATVIEKFYHKTKPFAFTIKEPGKETYTIIATESPGVYSTKILGELKYEKFDTSHWTMKHPEPDDYNPNTGDPFPERDHAWWKACEWHKRVE